MHTFHIFQVFHAILYLPSRVLVPFHLKQGYLILGSDSLFNSGWQYITTSVCLSLFVLVRFLVRFKKNVFQSIHHKLAIKDAMKNYRPKTLYTLQTRIDKIRRIGDSIILLTKAP